MTTEKLQETEVKSLLQILQFHQKSKLRSKINPVITQMKMKSKKSKIPKPKITKDHKSKKGRQQKLLSN